MRVMQIGILAAALLVVAISPAKADVYTDTFTSGIDFTVNDPFWLNNNLANGFITTTTNTPAIWPGDPGEFGNEISSGVGGTGNFLFDGTYNYNGSGDPDIPAGHDEFYIGSSFAVD